MSDTSLRVMVTRGNRVLHWSIADLPPGVVDDGAVIDGGRFLVALKAVVESIHEGSSLSRRRAGVVISGRNTVQGRFVVLDPGGRDMAAAVRSLAAERMSITPSEVQLDWDAQPLEPAGDEDDPGPGAPRFDDEDAGEPYEVYALGIFKNTLESNLRPLKQAGVATAAVAPKSLALAAAVARDTAIIVEAEIGAISVVVVKDGLPEVVRDMRSSDGVDDEQWGRALAAHVERTVEFHDILNPGHTVGPDTPVFITGSGAEADRAARALKGRRYNVAAMPVTVSAPAGFPSAEMAANVGIAALRGRRIWQRRLTPDVRRPDLHFVPAAYQPRSLPVRPIAAGAAAAAFAIGVAAGYGQVSGVRADTDAARSELSVLERRLDQMSSQVRQLVRDEARVAAVRGEAEAVLNASEAIRDRNAGFSPALDMVAANVPAGVSLDEVDDDGQIVVVRASAPTYESLLDFTRNLERAEGLLDVRITSIGSSGGRGSPSETDLFALFPGLSMLGDEPLEQPPAAPAAQSAPPATAVGSKPSLELELAR